MALNAGIFGNMLSAPRSAMDYQNEYAAQDDQKVLRQANLLALQDKRQAAADAALQRQQAQDVRNKLTGLPATATPEDVARVYQGAGMVDHAEKVLKSWTDRQKELAGIDKTKGETLDGALTRHRAMLEQAQTPQDAARMLAAQYSDPILGPVMAKTHGPLEAAVQAIPQTPAEFAQWRGANTMGMTKYQEHVAQKPTAVDLGDRKVMVDMNPNSPTYLKQVAENKVGQSPESVATNAATRRGQDMTAATAAAARAQSEAHFKATEAGKATKPNPEVTKVADANEALQLIADAEKILGGATGSYVGAGIDLAGQAVGLSTKGAQAAAQLKAIEGMLVSKMPKMSGPQSDKDVALYRQMAGMIGDSTVPTETKKAALKSIKEIQSRYAGAPAAAPANPRAALGVGAMPAASTAAPAAGGWSITRVD